MKHKIAKVVSLHEDLCDLFNGYSCSVKDFLAIINSEDITAETCRDVKCLIRRLEKLEEKLNILGTFLHSNIELFDGDTEDPFCLDIVFCQGVDMATSWSLSREEFDKDFKLFASKMS